MKNELGLGGRGGARKKQIDPSGALFQKREAKRYKEDNKSNDTNVCAGKLTARGTRRAHLKTKQAG
jgi:hypothetical protein